MRPEVTVVTGLGGMGEAIARRLSPGHLVVLADVNVTALEEAARAFTERGHDVRHCHVDVADRASVAALADTAGELGTVRSIIHTAGVSPAQASTELIISVDLLGTAYVLAEFERVMASGSAGVVVASMAAHQAMPIAPEDEAALATSPVADLAGLAAVEAIRGMEPAFAYGFAKRANLLRVRAASVPWGRRGSRINSISPGVIQTRMGQAELDGPFGTIMRAMVDGSGTGRTGTAEEIAAVVAFLVSPAAAFVTGTDLLVDGGVTAALTTGQVTF